MDYQIAVQPLVASTMFCAVPGFLIAAETTRIIALVEALAAADSAVWSVHETAGPVSDAVLLTLERL